jgi:hypothetical protein
MMSGLRRPRACSNLKALNLAENATHNLHNGAQVRDALAWARYINEARDQYAPKVDVMFAQHHWPIWGNGRVLDFRAKIPARSDRAIDEPRAESRGHRRATHAPREPATGVAPG